MVGPVSVLCQSAIFHRFVSLLEVKPIWVSFINPKVLLLAGAELSAPTGWRAKAEVGHKERVQCAGAYCTCMCECVFMCMYACAHVSDTASIHPSNRVTLTGDGLRGP